MGLLLCIETATTVCSVALANDGHLLGVQESFESNAHSARLTTLIETLLRDHTVKLSDLDAVAVSKGPGSYTGLRIGVSAAKGLCYGLDKPLIGISTLQAMAVGIAAQSDLPNDCLICPMIDARRMEVYRAFYNTQFEEIQSPLAEIITSETLVEWPKQPIVCAGDGAAKCQILAKESSLISFPEVTLPSARFMISLAEQAFQAQRFEDVAYFEPYYLKDFIAGAPKVKGL